ncbi:MAG TPA: hypothetical protein DCG69_03830 [Bacteroidales bacterium]|nr:hypothetical protein [Bacteroidales bacterium]
MKKVSYKRIAILMVGLMGFSCVKETSEAELVASPELTAVELDMMKYMMEEEKLAYDVYVTLYEQFGLATFNNIAKSELSHMNAASKLLEKYGVENTASTTLGVFNDEHLQSLYNALIAQGSWSLVDALKVGATIEDVDIYDLEDFMEKTENEDIHSVFDFLDCGSRNHLRSFINQLTIQGAVYSPQYISQEHFDAILTGDKETCGTYTL